MAKIDELRNRTNLAIVRIARGVEKPFHENDFLDDLITIHGLEKSKKVTTMRKREEHINILEEFVNGLDDKELKALRQFILKDHSEGVSESTIELLSK